MSIIDEIQNLDWSDRRTQLIVGGGTAAVVGYMYLSAKRQQSNGGTERTDAATEAARQLEPPANIEAGKDGIPGWVGFPDWPINPTTPTPTQPGPTTPAPTEPAGPCGPGKVPTYRNGALVCYTPASGAYEGQKCPPGYVAVSSPTHGTRCVQTNDMFGKAAGPTSYIPTDLQGTYEKGFRGTTAAAGEAFRAPDRYLHAGTAPGLAEDVGGQAYGGGLPVRAFSPVARPITAVRSYTVRENDTLASIARRLYGNAEFWPMLASKNGPQVAQLQAGQRLRT